MEHHVHITTNYRNTGTMTSLLHGTPENIGKHVTRLVKSGLEKGELVEVTARPVHPANVWTADDEGMARHE